MHQTLPCPLCHAEAPHWFADHWRDYYRCSRCALVAVPPHQHPSPEEEKAEYALHDNAVDDPGYRRFLARLANPLLDRLPQGSTGIDFGCGPGPALAAMLEEAGHRVRLYDPFFYPDASVLQPGQDFITATEVLEHLSRAGEELERLWGLLRPGGWLAVMTQRLPAHEAFAGWHYRRERSHICFFDAETFRWLAQRWKAELVLEGRDVALLRKPLAP